MDKGVELIRGVSVINGATTSSFKPKEERFSRKLRKVHKGGKRKWICLKLCFIL